MYVDCSGSRGLRRGAASVYARFMQPDPIGYGDGLNWYNYVGGDPVNHGDPSGTRVPNYCTGSLIPSDDCSQVPFLSMNGVDTQAAHMEKMIEIDSLMKSVAGYLNQPAQNSKWHYVFDSVSKNDLDLLKNIMNDKSVVSQMRNAWDNTLKYGNEKSFFIYKNGSDFFTGKVFSGNEKMVSDPMEIIERLSSQFPAVANYHTHPGAYIEAAYPSGQDIRFNEVSETIGIIQTRYRMTYGRSGKNVYGKLEF